MRLLLAIAAFLLAGTAWANDQLANHQKAKPPSDIHAANAKLGRGINLGNALEAPEEGTWGVRLKGEYFAEIKKAGFATVRLPVRWSAHASATAPYAIDPPFARTRHVAREAERLGFSWANWEFCAGFGAYDSQARAWRESLRSALLD